MDSERGGHTDSVYCLTSVVDKNGNYFIYSGSRDCTIRKWNDKGKCVQVLDRERGGHTEYLRSLISVVDKNGNYFIYSGSYDCTIRKWGEYWPCYYNYIPETQTVKFQNWRLANTNIQKDLKFLFERELLNN